MLAIGYVAVSMLGVAAFALFFSTLTDSPLGATMGALAVLVASSLLFTLDAASPIAPYLPTRYWLAFVDLFRDPILWRDITAGAGAAGRLRRRAARRRLGELHDQGRHQLDAGAVPSLAGREPRGAGQPVGGQRRHAVAELVGERGRLVEAVLLEQRRPVAAQAGLREGRELPGERLRRLRAPGRAAPPG